MFTDLKDHLHLRVNGFTLSQKLRIRFNSIRNLGTKINFLTLPYSKNAGSSIKHMLHKNFGNKHFDIDKPYARHQFHLKISETN